MVCVRIAIYTNAILCYSWNMDCYNSIGICFISSRQEDHSETMKRAVSCISGLDSTGYAAQWKAKGYAIYPILFDYGQKGRKEIDVSIELSRELDFEEPLVVDIGFMKNIWSGVQLTDDSISVEALYTPTVVVPIRNVIFLSIASAYALMIGAKIVTYGAHMSDIQPRTDTGDPLYPDCHPNTAMAFEEVLRYAHFPFGVKKIEIWSPAREGLTKAENLRRSFNVMGDLIYKTWSCYLSKERHCGKCESCINRHRAFIEAGIPDLTEYEVDPEEVLKKVDFSR
ncbi:MAG: 7-cyano-7-deazaguanine synthase [Thermoprotei archaeon]|nr:MAG: 7-cyano-7-deazaguanine synthase [Thermoprotei archaeon]